MLDVSNIPSFQKTETRNQKNKHKSRVTPVFCRPADSTKYCIASCRAGSSSRPCLALALLAGAPMDVPFLGGTLSGDGFKRKAEAKKHSFFFVFDLFPSFCLGGEAAGAC